MKVTRNFNFKFTLVMLKQLHHLIMKKNINLLYKKLFGHINHHYYMLKQLSIDCRCDITLVSLSRYTNQVIVGIAKLVSSEKKCFSFKKTKTHKWFRKKRRVKVKLPNVLGNWTLRVKSRRYIFCPFYFA